MINDINNKFKVPTIILMRLNLRNKRSITNIPKRNNALIMRNSNLIIISID
jgi:hypothetical protein